VWVSHTRGGFGAQYPRQREPTQGQTANPQETPASNAIAERVFVRLTQNRQHRGLLTLGNDFRSVGNAGGAIGLQRLHATAGQGILSVFVDLFKTIG
jgi:hypothetical protein